MLDWGELPQRNLPDDSVGWARELEKRSTDTRRALRAGKDSLSGANRSDAAVTAELARRIQKLRSAAEDLEEAAEDLEDAAGALEDAFEALPVTVHAAASESGVQSYGTWDNDVFARLTVPPGKTRANIIAIGYERLWAWDNQAGGGSGPGPSPIPGGGNLPTTLNVTSNTGGTFTMNSKMIGYADGIRRTAEASGANREAVIIAFMTVFVESVWLMYANVNVPGSTDYPHDAVGSDNYSVGLYQQQSQWGWGSTGQLMDVTFSTRAFIGGPSGPHAGNPPGLLDIPGWENMPKGVAAQEVQGSAYPDRYQAWETGATQLYAAIANSSSGSTLQWPFVPEPSPNGDMPPVGSTDEPLAEFGPRALTGAFHEGMDFGYRNATSGATIPAAGAGTVHLNQAGFSGYGNTIIINHGTLPSGFTVYTLYGHRQAVAGPAAGQPVSAGQAIGNVGNSGASLGPHLHFEVHLVPPGGSLTWDYNNPSFTSSRTAVNPRSFVGSGSIDPGTGPDPEPGGTAFRIYSRVSIGGTASHRMHGVDDGDFEVLRPVWGRSLNVTPGQGITVALQSTTDSVSSAKKSASVSQLTVIANFS